MNIFQNRRQHLFSILLIFVGFLCMEHASAFCLDGRRPSLAIETKSSNFIIIGRVKKATDYTSPDDPDGIAGTKYVVSVMDVLRGNPPKTLIVNSENTSSRFPLIVGQRYLLFIKGLPTDGLVDSCGNSGAANEKKAVIAKLRGNRIKA